MTTTTKERRQHVTVLDGPDSAGHWGYRCTDPDCGDERSGYEPDEVAEQAELHGPLAVDSPTPDPDGDDQ